MHRNKISTWPNLCGIGFPTEYQGVATKLALGLGLMKQKVDSYYLHVIFNEIATLFLGIGFLIKYQGFVIKLVFELGLMKYFLHQSDFCTNLTYK